MSYVPPQLTEMVDKVKQGHQPASSVREFISWFWGSKRRGSFTVYLIRQALADVGLKTMPDFDATYLDADIKFVAADAHTGAQPQPAEIGLIVDDAMVMMDSVSVGARVDPSYRVARLKSAHTMPVAVAPDTSVAEAVTIMMKQDFSQLPVISGERTVKGLISWKSLGKRLAMSKKCSAVREAMEPVHIIDLDTSLFEAVALIAKHDSVLVRDEAGRVCGIMTAYDVSHTFAELGEPFLLLGEIENLVRDMMDGRFTKEDLEKGRDPLDGTRPILRVSDLNFGGYVRILQDSSSWEKVRTNLDRGTFISYLERVREIRNETMHFDPDGIDDKDLTELREFAELLKQVKEIAAAGG